MRAWVASWAGVLVGLFLVPIYAFYFLLEKRDQKPLDQDINWLKEFELD